MVSDFDIEIEFENFSADDKSRCFIRLVADEYNWFDISRSRDASNNQRIRHHRLINNSLSIEVHSGITETSGKLRITRSTNTLSCYYDIGGGWVHLETHSDDSFLGEMYVVVGLEVDDQHCSCDMKGFTINSGITTNLVGWAREGFNVNRGLAQEFPAHSLIVCTDESVEIIDTDTDLLWMRFIVSGTNVSTCHALHNFSPGPKPVKTYMKNGILLISYSTDDDLTGEGGLIIVDFALDDIRICREQGSSYTGASLRGWNGVRFGKGGELGIQITNGLVAARNLDAGYYTDRDNYQINEVRPTYSHFYETGGFIYRAITTRSGLTVQKWRRGYLDGNSSSGENIDSILYGESIETDDMRWCWFNEFTGDLFYMSSDKFFQVGKATLDANLSDSGGSFGANTTINPLIGIRSYNSQVHAFYSSDTGSFYVPSDEGVYKIAWPSGVVTFFYGKDGSGAEHEIFNSSYNKVLSVGVVVDSMIPYLIVGLEYGNRRNTSGIIFAVNLSTNEVYSKSSIDFGKPPKSIAV